MKIERFTLYKPTLEMSSPFVTSLRTVEALETVLLQIETDGGISGWGEAPVSPKVTGESPDASLAALDFVIPELLGKDPLNREGIHSKMASLLKGNSAAKAGVDIALHDLLGKVQGEPLWKLIGGFRSNRISTDFTVSLMDPEEMAERAKQLVSEGFGSLKIKLGEDPARDMERLKEIDTATGGRPSYRIDANQGWTRTESLRFINMTGDIDVEFIEQPVKDEDLVGMKRVRQALSIPIMADESVHGPDL
ncbi:dipeptide epimerase, partial [Candidatus Bipolaricaulota bacterium]|nr:dipeptide epimerase [Candidatus Bipolaricaulota bacterium]